MFFKEVVGFDFNDFHIRMQIYKCKRAYACACMHVCVHELIRYMNILHHVYACVRACVRVCVCVCVHFAIPSPSIDVGVAGFASPILKIFLRLCTGHLNLIKDSISHILLLILAHLQLLIFLYF